MIQRVKNFLKIAYDSNTDPYIALLQYRNAPLSGLDFSPAQLLMSRFLRIKLPTTSQNLHPKVVDARDNLVYRQQQQQKYYDRKSKPLSSLNKGDVVRMNYNETWKRGIVRFKHQASRSYIVDTEDGSTLTRNRRDLIYTTKKYFKYFLKMCVGMISSKHVLDGESSIIFTRSFSVISRNDSNTTFGDCLSFDKKVEIPDDLTE
ncbi:hypothetical protein HELRODRAFT_181129 [Helobdella robusta]|uniref:Uncharacterized protein n=1 Tax=Helobdella robusta TaxID=6412 RepID=T1FGN2_HELRO|nr:hypothetical protein HELRODRAFT_181129 [Helobdella robusta]ESN93207.1 hypothetical protein HELRODRAFT_181129 [Helobdella robusta]